MLIPLFEQPIPPPIVIKEEQPPSVEKLYTIKENDTLTKIAQENQTTIERLWEKNTDLKDPDLLEPNYQLKLPSENEELPDRPLPTPPPVIEPVRVPQSGTPASNAVRGAVTGNTYYAGQCVWYVKNQLSWVENGWGNASSWKYTSGHTVSTTPAVGTVAWAKSYGHVAIVTGVGNGTVSITEMNYEGAFVVSSRVAPTSEFEYIYP